MSCYECKNFAAYTDGNNWCIRFDCPVKDSLEVSCDEFEAGAYPVQE